MTHAEFLDALKAHGVPRDDLAVICPMCRTVQSARDLIRAGAGADFDAVSGSLGYSCVGRWTNAGSPRKRADGQPCDWSLGGLFRMHELEVVTEDGKRHPHFEIATPEQAQAHAAAGAA